MAKYSFEMTEDELEAAEMMQLQKMLNEEAGIFPSEDHKPEWLRGISGAGAPRTANWVPADKDGNPLKD